MTRREDDDSHDAHLLAALRHAPDRDALPPRDVSERILAAARAAVRPTPQAAPVRWWQRVSAWLMRPQVATAFGTLAVASLVGVMWSTREPPVAEFVPPPASADRADQRPIAEAPVTAPHADAAKSDATGAATAPAATGEVRPNAAAAPRPKQAPAKDPAGRAELRSRTAPEAPVASAATTTTATPSAAPPPPTAADAAVPAAAAERRSANASESQVLARQQGAAAPRPASAAALGMPLAAKAQAVADPLASLDRRLAPWPEHMSWTGAGRQWAHQAPQAAWWSRFKQGTVGTWQALPRVPPVSQPWLALSMAGIPVATIDLVGDSVVFCPAEGAVCWRAPITPAQRDAWTAEVARW